MSRATSNRSFVVVGPQPITVGELASMARGLATRPGCQMHIVANTPDEVAAGEPEVAAEYVESNGDVFTYHLKNTERVR